MNNQISIYYQNCRGLRTKLHTLYMNILSNCYDIIILTETWLHFDIADNEFIDTRYKVFRKDRDRKGSGRRDGGGALVAVRRELHVSELTGTCAGTLLDTPLSLSIDLLMLELRIDDTYYFISAIYIPPGQSYDTYYSFLCLLENRILNMSNYYNNFFIVGDFNMPNIEWTRDSSVSQLHPVIDHSPCLSYSTFLNFMSAVGGFQLNGLRNKNSSILDFFITNETNCNLLSVATSLVPCDDHHPPFQVFIPLTKQFKELLNKPYTKFIFKDVDYAKVREDIRDTNWVDLFSNKNVESATAIFYEKLYGIYKKHIPTKVINLSHNQYPVWFTLDIIHLFKKKTKAWIKMKKYNSDSNYKAYSVLRRKFKYKTEKCFKNYLSNVEKSIRRNIKFFWTYISNRKNANYIPSYMVYKNVAASEASEICELFSNYFQSVFTPSQVPSNFDINDISIDDLQSPHNLISNLNFSKIDVNKTLLSLDITKGPGVDNIHACFLKEVADVIDEPLHFLYNKCLYDGEFPSVWKTARIVPVHKGGPENNVENYRPISILPILSKILERLVHNAMYPSIHNIIIPQQHGFMQKRSTVTNLLSYTTYLFEALDANKQTDCIYTDFQKAFDRVDHKILLEKLAFNGIRGNLWRWFKSYLSARSQRVVLKGFESSCVPVSSGVPQGSILGPLLFLIFVNDIGICFKHCHFLMYADDLKIYRTIECSEDPAKIQDDLDRFSIYCRVNGLNLSLNKCKSLTITKKKSPIDSTYWLSGVLLERVKQIRDLGITLDTKLHFDIHVENIVNKAFKMYGFVLRSCNGFKDYRTYLYLYKSLIRSQLEYAVAIWNPLYLKYINGIEMVQKKFLKCIHYKCTHSHLSYDLLLDVYSSALCYFMTYVIINMIV